jgi:hypothetical protein
MAAAMIPIGTDGRSATCHEITNISIEVDEAAGNATAQSYWTLYQSIPGKPRLASLAGRYRDEFRRGDDRWFFTRRDAIILWNADLPISADALTHS